MCESFSSFVGRTVHKLLLSLDLTTSENFESEKLFVREKKPVVYSDIKTKKNTMHRLVKSVCKCTCQMLPRSNTKFVWILNKMCNSQRGDQILGLGWMFTQFTSTVDPFLLDTSIQGAFPFRA